MARAIGSLDVFEVRVIGDRIERARNANTGDAAFVAAERNIIDD